MIFWISYFAYRGEDVEGRNRLFKLVTEKIDAGRFEWRAEFRATFRRILIKSMKLWLNDLRNDSLNIGINGLRALLELNLSRRKKTPSLFPHTSFTDFA